MKSPEYLGPYRIGETLGKGGMGSVFKARHAKSGQEVAVKLIATQVSDEMRFRRRFDAEIETLKRLSHPNIVKLIGYGEEHGMLFYSMEYVPGDTLQAKISRDKKLPWMTAIDIAIQVCAALKHAHDFGVIHRDLKPANLIVQDDGTVKLLDFGISKIFGYDQTAVGSIMGTADYMSPEQANESGVTARTDLFALGCVIYAMLCGKPPFRGKNITEVITALNQRDPVPLDLIDPELPDDIVQIVSELIEKSPEDRPPTALAVMNRLKAMRAGLQRMQTLTDEKEEDDRPKDKADGPASGGTTKKRVKPQGAVSSDTAEGAAGESTADPLPRQSDKTRASDTVPFLESSDGQHTALVDVDLSARTVATEGRGGDRATVLGTGITASFDAKQPGDEAGERDDAGGDFDVATDSDTSVGTAGKTHFQTVSDGEVREGFFSTPQTKTEHPAKAVVTIASLVIILFVAGVFMLQSLKGPTADELLAVIDNGGGGEQTYQIENEIERFLKLFPDHPRAEGFRDRQMVSRVEAAVRRLKLKAKLRTTDGPLYEQAFLDAMDLRQSDPAAAREKLDQWVDVFQDSTMDTADVQLELAGLAKFESARLAAVLHEGDAVPGDPKLAELLQRIEAARELPLEERTRLLEGIITLYEGQPWAEEARRRAQELLGES